MIAGAVVVIPAIAATIWALGRLGYGDPHLGLLRAIRVTALFAGAAAVLTAGGVGRLAAQAATDEGATRRRPLWVGARAFAVAGFGLAIIAALPHGHLPQRWTGFLLIGGAGAATGALCGAIIGAACGGAAPLGLTDVMSLARWPTDALRALLEPEDLAVAAKAGVARRRRRITIPFFFPARPEVSPPVTAVAPAADEGGTAAPAVAVAGVGVASAVEGVGVASAVEGVGMPSAVEGVGVPSAVDDAPAMTGEAPAAPDGTAPPAADPASTAASAEPADR